MLFTLGAFAGESIPTSVKFKEGNFFAITTQFDNQLLDNFTEKLLNYEDDELLIYFDTPGGSVIALSRMAVLMKSSDVKFTCVASFAASAGFMLFEHCTTRLLLSDGILMSHNWSGGFQGEAPRIMSLFNVIQDIVDTLEDTIVSKLNVDKKEYASLINSNLWMTTTLATKYGAIDGVVNKISCDSELIKKRLPVIAYTYRGIKTLYRSGCPLIQKLYQRRSNQNNDIYFKTNMTLFNASQRSYKPEQANWIYMGNKRK